MNRPHSSCLTDQSVGEIVAVSPGLSRVFEAYQIDFCCRGGKTVREACEAGGQPLVEVVNALEKALHGFTEVEPNPGTLPPAPLIDHIVERHHGFLRRELPRLHSMAQRVAEVHGDHTPSLVEVFRTFQELFIELDSHMMKEEQVLFPAIKALASNEASEGRICGSLREPIAMMRHEHDEAGEALHHLRSLTDGYQPPGDACNTYRALFSGLAELERDLHIHIHLENAVLFPTAEALAA